MPKASAGILVYRRGGDGGLEVLLAHPGGPYWKTKDDGAWSIPKGEIDDPGEEPLAVARREFEEELGSPPPETSHALPLGEVRQASGKTVTAWAVEGDLDVSRITSNTFEMEWPPRSGKKQAFPEIDRAGWFTIEEARRKLIAGQVAFLDRLGETLPTA
jgi:predicted NUDIX family NTP pyrophosphohydrolase